MKSLNQLLLDFDYEQNFKDDDFYVGKSNFYAFEMINKWPKWEKNFLNIKKIKYQFLLRDYQSQIQFVFWLIGLVRDLPAFFNT